MACLSGPDEQQGFSHTGLQRRVRKTNYPLSFSAVDPRCLDVRGRTGSPKSRKKIGATSAGLRRLRHNCVMPSRQHGAKLRNVSITSLKVGHDPLRQV